MSKVVWVVRILLLLGLSGNVLASDWELQKDDDGIRVFTRDVELATKKEGVETSQEAYRGITRIKTTIKAIEDAMRDVPSIYKWLHNTEKSSLLEKLDDDTRIVYEQIHTPWPTSDRDTVLLQHIAHEGNKSFLYMDSVEHPDMPVNDDFVRIPYYKGYWSFEPVGEGELEVIYEGAFDTGGQVPAFMANLFLVDTPFYSLKNLRDYLQDQQQAQ